MGIFSESRYERTSPLRSLESKSVRNSPMGAWQSIVNLWSALTRDVVMFWRP